jgi:hypothetical protein
MTTHSQQKSGEGCFESFGRKVDEHVTNAVPRMEEEVRKVISYLNDEVVPDVRSNSSRALRVAAEKLGSLAEYLERNNRGTR